jgi:hypothetical protein
METKQECRAKGMCGETKQTFYGQLKSGGGFMHANDLENFGNDDIFSVETFEGSSDDDEKTTVSEDETEDEAEDEAEDESEKIILTKDTLESLSKECYYSTENLGDKSKLEGNCLLGLVAETKLSSVTCEFKMHHASNVMEGSLIFPDSFQVGVAGYIYCGEGDTLHKVFTITNIPVPEEEVVVVVKMSKKERKAEKALRRKAALLKRKDGEKKTECFLEVKDVPEDTAEFNEEDWENLPEFKEAIQPCEFTMHHKDDVHTMGVSKCNINELRFDFVLDIFGIQCF